MDQLPRFGKRELICLLLFTCNYVVSVWRGFLFLWVLGMGYLISLWHSLSLPYNYFTNYLHIKDFKNGPMRTSDDNSEQLSRFLKFEEVSRCVTNDPTSICNIL